MSPDSERPAEQPVEYVVEFGELIPYRRGGCPRCGNPVTASASTCGACGQTFSPVDQVDSTE